MVYDRDLKRYVDETISDDDLDEVTDDESEEDEDNPSENEDDEGKYVMWN